MLEMFCTISLIFFAIGWILLFSCFVYFHAQMVNHIIYGGKADSSTYSDEEEVDEIDLDEIMREIEDE